MLIYIVSNQEIEMGGTTLILKEWLELKTHEEMTEALQRHPQIKSLADEMHDHPTTSFRRGIIQGDLSVAYADILTAFPDRDAATLYMHGYNSDLRAPEGIDREVFNAAAPEHGWNSLPEPSPDAVPCDPPPMPPF